MLNGFLFNFFLFPPFQRNYPGIGHILPANSMDPFPSLHYSTLRQHCYYPLSWQLSVGFCNIMCFTISDLSIFWQLPSFLLQCWHSLGFHLGHYIPCMSLTQSGRALKACLNLSCASECSSSCLVCWRTHSSFNIQKCPPDTSFLKGRGYILFIFVSPVSSVLPSPQMDLHNVTGWRKERLSDVHTVYRLGKSFSWDPYKVKSLTLGHKIPSLWI